MKKPHNIKIEININQPLTVVWSTEPMKQLLGLKDVIRLTGLSKNTIRRLAIKNQFPRRRKLSIRRIGWTEGDINDWIASTSTN